MGVRSVGWAGILLVASGVLYAAVHGVVGGPWEGPVSTRKPILFGLSTGITLLSLRWVLAGLPRRTVDGLLYGTLALALVIEVGLIDLQHARGVPSHFNHATPVDEAISMAMTALIIIASIIILEITVRALGPLDFASDDALAARAGMVFLVIACLLGGMITWMGEANIAAGRDPGTLGAAGVLKFPHGLPLHAIQVLYVQSRVLRRFGVGGRTRRASLKAVIIGFVAVTAYGLVQTAAGAPRFPPANNGAWLLAAATAAAMSWAGFVVARSVARPRGGS